MLLIPLGVPHNVTLGVCQGCGFSKGPMLRYRAPTPTSPHLALTHPPPTNTPPPCSKNKFEKVKAEKCGSTAWTEVHELAEKLRCACAAWRGGRVACALCMHELVRCLHLRRSHADACQSTSHACRRMRPSFSSCTSNPGTPLKNPNPKPRAHTHTHTHTHTRTHAHARTATGRAPPRGRTSTWTTSTSA